jgi:ribonucleotide reductase beta subunit family protein with ferritin-like domain
MDSLQVDYTKKEILQKLKLKSTLKINRVKIKAVKEEINNEEKFYCLTVPSGAFAVNYNQVNSITGNCHYNGMSDIFKILLKENLEYHTDELKEEIYDIARNMVDLEDKFIDLCFEMGGIEGLTADETKTYIRYICDRRLIGLGYKGIYKVKTNPLVWVEEMLNAPGHANFFEVRSTDYSRGVHTGSWTSFWQQPIK